MSTAPRPRTVLVTGAARRLGRSIALELAAGGWQVAVHYRQSEQDAIDTVAACAELSGASAHFDADFQNEACVRAPLPRAVGRLGSERAAKGEMDAQGAVVNLLDQKLWNQNPDFLSYTLSKAALEAAGTMLALALAPRVRVVGVAPGLTLTSHLLSEEQFRQRHTLSPLGRSSTAEDVASAVRFALENRSLTGTTLLVDGGQHLMKFDRDFSLM